MKRLSSVILILLAVTWPEIFGQQDTLQSDTLKFWNYTGMASLNFSQTSFSKNWQAGGQSSIAGLGLFNYTAKYAKNKSSWDNILDVKYGLTRLADDDTRKTDDNFEILSKYGYQAFEKWFYSAMLNFKTQMTDGKHESNRDSVISKLMAPGYILASLGMDYKEGDVFSLFISPVTGKITFVLDDTFSDEGRFGVEPGNKSRFELGALLKSILVKEIIKNVTLNSKFGMFYNYLEDPQIDIDWEVLVNMKVNQYISANLVTQLVYDKDQVDEVQFKEIIGIGLTCNF
ncbi:MAG: DUF3078 domain-containing protein [Bacteroidales bacterium]|nr:DUF3078 domain-containing protein [Bacteroidales bacterium]